MKKDKLATEAKQFALSLRDKSFYGKQENFFLTPGQYVKCLRTTFGVRRKELAQRLNISPSTLANWESDLVPLTLERLDRIYWVLMGRAHD